MLCTFTIKAPEGAPDHTLVIRSEDIRRIVDDLDGSTQLMHVIGDKVLKESIVGTARENLDRLQLEEFANIERAHMVQKRIEGGYPAVGVPRRKAAQK